MIITFKLYLFSLTHTCFTTHKGWTQSSASLNINELLINPNNVASSTAFEFIELYNNSSSTIDLKSVILHVNNKLENRVITNQFDLLEGKQYLAVTINNKTIVQHYPNSIQENIFETASLTPYKNQQNAVTLFTDQIILLDLLYYSAGMHSTHMIDPKGVSLERTNIAHNTFHSESTVYGGATPGYPNSTMELDIHQNKIYLTSKIFSTNYDGYEDELVNNYKLIHPDNIMAEEIYNEKYQLVKKLAHQNLAGTDGTIIWDGKTDTGQCSARGHYNSIAQIFNHNGKTQNFKQPFVLINSLTRH